MVPGPSPSMCDLCGAEMPPYEVRDHQTSAHRDLLEKREREFSHALRRAALFVIPSGIAFFLALFVPAVIFGISEPGWYLGVVFLAFMASAIAPIPYFAKQRRAYLESGGDLVVRCAVCDLKTLNQKMWAHMDFEHPGEAKRLKLLRVLVYGSLLALAIGFLAVLWGALVGIFPFEWGYQARTFTIVSLVLWGAVFVPWVALFERPHRAKVRAEWQATHVLTQPRTR